MAIQNTFYLDVDIKRDNYVDEPKVTQNDAVTFVLRMTDDGVDYPLAGVSTYTLASLRPDNQSVLTVGTLTGVNEITFELGSTEVSVPGNVKAAIQLYDVDGRVSSIPFTYEVTKDIATGYIPSVEEKTLIELVLGEGPVILAEARQATVDAIHATSDLTILKTDVIDATNVANSAAGFANTEGSRASTQADRADLAATNAEGVYNAILPALPNIEGWGYDPVPYNSATNYKRNNIVSHNGSTFISLVDNNTGNTPSLTPNANWGVLARKGIDGTGAVSSVNNVGPDENGDVILDIYTKNETDNRIGDLFDTLSKNTPATELVFNRGIQVVTVPIGSPVNVLNFTGKTIINYIPLFNSGLWTLHSNSTVLSANKMSTQGNGVDFLTNGIVVEVDPSTDYIVSSIIGNIGGYMSVFFIDTNGISSGEIDNSYSQGIGENTISFTTNSDTSKVLLRLTVHESSSDVCVFEDVSLVEGGVTPEFVANIKGLTNPTIENTTNNNSMVVIGTFHHGDVVTLDGQQAKALRSKCEKILDGSLNWGLFTSAPDFKIVRFSLTNGKAYSERVSKSNGQILKASTSLSTSDLSQLYTDGNMYISIANSDSGWNELYSPTSDEIKAYFNVNPYFLIYELTTPVEEPVRTTGSLSFVNGDNHIDVTEGRIIAEKVKPVFDNAGYYEINWKDELSSHTLYKTGTILRVYRNGKVDAKWIIQTTEFANGNQRAIISAEEYEPNATYELDYIPLEMFEVSTHVTSINVSHSDTLGGVVSNLVGGVTQLNSRFSTTENMADNLNIAIQMLQKISNGEITKSVKDFGAIGDGVTEENTAITAAISSLRTGETLYFPEGTYMIRAGFAIPSNVTLKGAGSHATTIKIDNNAYNTIVFSLPDVSNVKIEGLKIEGNKVNQINNGIAISLHKSSYCTIKDVKVNNQNGIGIGLSESYNCDIVDCEVRNSGNYQPGFWSDATLGAPYNTGNIRFINCEAHSCDLDGIIVNTSNTLVEKGRFHNNGLKIPAYTGALGAGGIYSDKNLKNLRVVGNHCTNNTEFGINVAATDSTITENICEHNALSGIHLRSGSKRVSISNNICARNGNSPTTTSAYSKSGISFDASLGLTITGNSCYDDRNGTAKQIYGIHALDRSGTSNLVVVTGNNLKFNVTGDENISTSTIPTRVVANNV